jgi:hypothetical protein
VAREAARRSTCSNNLKVIGLALQNYRDAYGCFPPAYVADVDGRPMHSWRVLILPFLEQEAIYDRYRFDEPWDGPNNRKLHDLIVGTYACPSHAKQGHSTAYVAVVGAETSWRGAEPTRSEDIADGASRTVMVVEVAAAAIHWMEPRDLEFGRMSFAIGGPEGSAGAASHHPNIAHALFADGTVRMLPQKTAPATVRGLLTVAGGEDASEVP